MDYKEALIDLIAYCQRNGALSSDCTAAEELAEILCIDSEEAEELLC